MTDGNSHQHSHQTPRKAKVLKLTDYVANLPECIKRLKGVLRVTPNIQQFAVFSRKSFCKWPHNGCNSIHSRSGSSQWGWGGAIAVIFGSQVSLRAHCCKRDEVCLTALLWQNNGPQNGLISQMLFSEFCKIMVNKVIFVGFIGTIAPIDPLSWIRTCFTEQGFVWKLR